MVAAAMAREAAGSATEVAAMSTAGLAVASSAREAAAMATEAVATAMAGLVAAGSAREVAATAHAHAHHVSHTCT